MFFLQYTTERLPSWSNFLWIATYENSFVEKNAYFCKIIDIYNIQEE